MIYTLNARGNVMLPVLKQVFQLTDQQSYQEIKQIFNDMNAILKAKGIAYKRLKLALIPAHKDRYEIAFIFDSSKIVSVWYGYTVFLELVPTLNKESTWVCQRDGGSDTSALNRIKRYGGVVAIFDDL